MQVLFESQEANVPPKYAMQVQQVLGFAPQPCRVHVRPFNIPGSSLRINDMQSNTLGALRSAHRSTHQSSCSTSMHVLCYKQQLYVWLLVPGTLPHHCLPMWARVNKSGTPLSPRVSASAQVRFSRATSYWPKRRSGKCLCSCSCLLRCRIGICQCELEYTYPVYYFHRASAPARK